MVKRKYITRGLLAFYRRTIESEGKVLTSPVIYKRLVDGNHLPDIIDKVEIAKNDELDNAKQEVITKTLEKLL